MLKEAAPRQAVTLPEDCIGWMRRVSPMLSDFAPHHVEALAWFENLAPGKRPRPLINIWPRGGGKSTILEHGAAYVGERGKRSFALYVCGTQAAAEKHTRAIQAIFERIGGQASQRLESGYGHSLGWRANLLRTAGGFNLVGLGLDTAIRGVKLEEFRPDLIILDDIDERHDSLYITRKKIEVLTESILPAGSRDSATVGGQNLIIPTGVFAQLAGAADFLARRILNGPIPAVRGLQVEPRIDEEIGRRVMTIVGGEPTWEGLSLADCQASILDNGWRSFDREEQHNVADVEGALWSSVLLNETRVTDAPPLTRVVIGVDPPASSKSSSNEAGIIAVGRTADEHGYVLADRSGILKPSAWGRRAVQLYDERGADSIVIETNQGGEMAEAVVRTAARQLHAEGRRSSAHVQVIAVHASKGKRARAEPVAQVYEEYMIHHVGDFTALEAQMTGWNAQDGSESPDRIDALVWACHALGLHKGPAIGGYRSFFDN